MKKCKKVIFTLYFVQQCICICRYKQCRTVKSTVGKKVKKERYKKDQVK